MSRSQARLEEEQLRTRRGGDNTGMPTAPADQPDDLEMLHMDAVRAVERYWEARRKMEKV